MLKDIHLTFEIYFIVLLTLSKPGYEQCFCAAYWFLSQINAVHRQFPHPDYNCGMVKYEHWQRVAYAVSLL